MTPFPVAEAVARGHPDKVADQIADAIVDYFVAIHPFSKVGCEILVTKKAVCIGGELPSYHPQDLEEIVRRTIFKIGYRKGVSPFNAEDVLVLFYTNTQGKELSGFTGAGDQGISIGYATLETQELMPKCYCQSREILQALEAKRDQGTLPFLGLDGKCMVTQSTLLISFQHSPDISLPELRKELLPHLPHHFKEILINPKGTFIEGGPSVDTGVTGRKIVYDSYGPRIPIGGGCFSGKDASKIDRTGAYYARYAARDIVSKLGVDSALVQLSFGIGYEKPLSIEIKTSPSIYVDPSPYLIDLEQMIDLLQLRRPIYLPTAYGGHFGRPEFPWEQK